MRRKKNKNEVQATVSASYCRLLQMQGERTTHATHSGTQGLSPSIGSSQISHQPRSLLLYFSSFQTTKLRSSKLSMRAQCLTDTGLTLQWGPNKTLEGETQGKTVVHNININQDICTFVVV